MTDDKKREYQRKYYADNAERLRQKAREYAAAHREESRERARKWRENNHERAKENQRAWGVAHREHVANKCKEWRKNNPERMAERRKKWRDSNPEKYRQAQRDWESRNPIKVRMRVETRRARRISARGHCSGYDAEMRIAYYGGMCAYCKVAPHEHLDHVIPLSRGGANWPANFRPSCRRCNRSKSNKLLCEWKGAVQ
jgi:5-methylcytosine-specific restriction endonuclease McrA